MTERVKPTSESDAHASTHTSTPVVLCVAPTGTRRNKTDHPELPMTAAEIGREASRCVEAGATVTRGSGIATADQARLICGVTQV